MAGPIPSPYGERGGETAMDKQDFPGKLAVFRVLGAVLDLASGVLEIAFWIAMAAGGLALLMPCWNPQ